MNQGISIFYKIIKRKETPLFLVLFITCLGLFGWIFGKSIFTSFSLEYIPIAPSSTAIFIILSVLSLLNSEKSRTAQIITSLSLVVITFYCLLIFLDHLFNFQWDLEKFFISNPERFWNVLQGRMSPITSVLFIFSCMGLWGIKQYKSNVLSYVGGGFSLAVWLLSSVLLIGYLYKAPLLYGSEIIPIALPTAICFLLFSVSLILEYKVQYWTFNLLKDNKISRQLLESFLPIVIFIVVLQGYLTTHFSINQGNPTFTAAIILLLVTVMTVITVIRVSFILGKRILKIENDLIKAKVKAEESDRLKSAFLANMSHEIRTPMNGILGFAELLKEPKLTGEEQQEYIGIIEKSGNRMLNIINDIINISKVESGQMPVAISEVNVNEQIEFIYNFFKPEAEQKGVKLHYKFPLPLKECNIETDREKVYAVLTNLVKNALKFTWDGSIEVGYERKNGFLEFFVKDTGNGIHQDHKELIFERFRQASESLTRNYEGAGLGLSISKAYVEMLGGKIWVESQIGKGAHFYFTLPYNGKMQAKDEGGNLSTINNFQNKTLKLKILIAEDDELSTLFLTKIVNQYSAKILKVKTGVEVVETAHKYPDIDLILMDIEMPEMDGYQATKRIRKFNKDVIIIAQTAFALSGDREKALEAGCNEYISKPISQHLLSELIKKHFKEQDFAHL